MSVIVSTSHWLRAGCASANGGLLRTLANGPRTNDYQFKYPKIFWRQLS
jgi:hypothetical protein